MKEVVIEIDSATGEISVEANGFVGPECTKATDWIVKALGSKATEKKKAEFNRVPVAAKAGVLKQGQ
jgi:hypothetical protein